MIECCNTCEYQKDPDICPPICRSCLNESKDKCSCYRGEMEEKKKWKNDYMEK